MLQPPYLVAPIPGDSPTPCSPPPPPVPHNQRGTSTARVSQPQTHQTALRDAGAR